MRRDGNTNLALIYQQLAEFIVFRFKSEDRSKVFNQVFSDFAGQRFGAIRHRDEHFSSLHQDLIFSGKGKFRRRFNDRIGLPTIERESDVTVQNFEWPPPLHRFWEWHIGATPDDGRGTEIKGDHCVARLGLEGL